ncbi:MAG: signal peptidase [Legionellales bacterium]|nr:signal peptidase [Legionellales bacterium]|tara:strand:- start:3832 stop:4434 length:603 start_codon:yes stop_codon:yes gene_type:complete
MRRIIASFIALFCIVGVAYAAQSPLVMLEKTSEQMLSSLTKNRAKIKSNPKYVETLARQILLPHVDTATMSRLALGRDGWNKATPAQRKEFSEQFVTMMIRTYSAAMNAYTDEKIKFYPIRGGVGDRKRVQVKSIIIQSGGPSIPVNYRLLLRGNNWKVYDMTVDGVSMVQSFKSQFANEISQGGINGLLAAMKKHNASS